jgi:hypothetical protein
MRCWVGPITAGTPPPLSGEGRQGERQRHMKTTEARGSAPAREPSAGLEGRGGPGLKRCHCKAGHGGLQEPLGCYYNQMAMWVSCSATATPNSCTGPS